MAASKSCRALAVAARPALEPGAAHVAVGQERAHRELLGEGRGLPERGLGGAAIPGRPSRHHLAQEVQGVGFVSALALLAGHQQGLAGRVVGLVEAAGAEIGLAQADEEERVPAQPPIARPSRVPSSSRAIASRDRPASE